METALQQFSVLPSTKEERTSFVNMAVNEFLSGNIDVLKTDAILKAAEDTIKAIRTNDEVKNVVSRAADEYPEKSFQFYNYLITKSSRRTYDWKEYKSDEILNGLNAQIEQLKKVIEARQQVILSGVDPATGETFSPVPFTENEILSYKLIVLDKLYSLLNREGFWIEVSDKIEYLLYNNIPYIDDIEKIKLIFPESEIYMDVEKGKHTRTLTNNKKTKETLFGKPLFE